MKAPRPAVDDGILGRGVGHYRITAFLAKGGMGTVYRAQHELIGKAAAVKVLRPELSRDPDMVQRFFNEARAASAIRHPGIVEVYDFGHLPNGRAYIVMEFLEGETLSRRLERCVRLPELAAAVIGRGVGVALAAAHAKGIVHRDLKPDNVFLVPDSELPSGERCKVLDFGIAKLLDLRDDATRTRTGTFMGTPLYMSPEQARGAGDLDHRADLYSLGCLLYEMVTGEPPYLAEGAAEILAQHMYGELTPPSARVLELSPELDALIVQLLAKDPADRPQTAMEVCERLSGTFSALSDRIATMAPMVPSASVMIAVPRRSPVPALGQDSRRGIARDDDPTTLGGSSGQSIRPKASRTPAMLAGTLMITAVALSGLALTRGEPTAVGAALEVGAAVPERAAKPVAIESLPDEPTPVPATVALTLAVEPPSAAVVLDGAGAVTREGVIRLPRDDVDHRVELSAPGYVTRTLLVRADRDQTVAVGLVPLPAVAKPRPRPAHSSAPQNGERRSAPRPALDSSPIEEEL